MPSRGYLLILLCLGLAAGVLSATATGAPTPLRVHFTAAGDYGANPLTTAPVLEGIAAAQADANFALGDLSYGTTGQESEWCEFVKKRVGQDFPFELISGNHESNGQNGNINDFSACLPNQLPGVNGTYGRQYYVDVPADAPLVRYVMVSPGVTYADGPSSYAAGTPRYNWTAAAIDGARARNIPWTVVGMHLPCMSQTYKACESGNDLTQMLLAKRVDLVLYGHAHSYERTKQLGIGAGCSQLAIDTFNPSCVVDSDDDMTAGAGTVFQTIGTGGTAQYDLNPADPEAGYFAASAGGATTPTFGFGDFLVTPEKLTATFRTTSGSSFADLFTLTKSAEPPANSAPVAAFTNTGTSLEAKFDATTSFDPDGLITSYAWDFGDGQSGTGVTPIHRYATAGTYTATLTTTDDDGATSSVSRTVTATTPPVADVLVSDTFERTLTNAWGNAETGNPWVVSSTSGVNSVSGGKGVTVHKTAGSTVSPRITDVSSTDTDMSLEFSVNALPTGSNAWVYESTVVRRVDGNNYYRGMIRISTAGAVRASLHRMLNGTGLMLSPEPVVPGLTYTAGDTLLVRTQATGTSPTTLRLKVWKKGTPEPSAWLLTATDTSAALQKPGTVGLISYLTSSVTNAPLQAVIDNLRVVRASSAP